MRSTTFQALIEYIRYFNTINTINTRVIPVPLHLTLSTSLMCQASDSEQAADA